MNASGALKYAFKQAFVQKKTLSPLNIALG